MPFTKSTNPGNLGYTGAKLPQGEDILALSATSGKTTPDGPSICTCNCARYWPVLATACHREPAQASAGHREFHLATLASQATQASEAESNNLGQLASNSAHHQPPSMKKGLSSRMDAESFSGRWW
jgi:hypothetical protein